MKSTRTCHVILFMILCLLFTVPAFADVLTIPVGVKEIGEEAFYGDTSLDQVVLPEGIERIGPRAFWGSSLSFINLPASLEYIGDDALDPDADIQVTAVKGSKAYDWAVQKGFIQEQEESSSITFKFEDNGDGTCTVTGIQSLTFDSFSKDLVIPSYGLEGKPVTAIGERAFAGMRDFKAGLVIPNSVTSIGDFAFAWCEGFTGNLTIPQSVTTIGNSAFSMCSGFTGNLTIPKNVTTIGNNAFRDCAGFTGSLIIPDSVIRIEDAAFGGCSGLNGTLTIGKNVTYIGASAFEMCTKLTGHVVIPPSVKEMGSGAFYGCSGLEEITVSDGITYFDFNTISDCSGLKRLNLPDSLTSIKDFNYSGDITELPSDFTVYSGSECARKWAYENYVSFNGGAVDYTPQMKRFLAQATRIRGETELNVYLEMDIDFLTYPISDDFYEYRNSIKGYWGTSNDKSKAGLLDPYSSGISSGRRVSVNGSYACGDYEGESCPEQIYLWFDMENSAGSVSYGPYRLDVQIRENELDNHLVYYPIDEATCSVAIEDAYQEEGELVIPDRAPDGRRVTHIKAVGFYLRDFSSVILPDSLIEIGGSAFGSMENITYISVPNHVKKIGDDAFSNCTALSTVVLPESIEYIAGGYYPGFSHKPLFDGCTSLSAIYCVRDSYAWNWCAENGYEDLLVAWDGTADPRPEQEYLTGAFDEETVTVALGTKQQISGRVKSKGDPLSRVTVTILGYGVLGNSDRYASKSFAGQNLKEITLADYGDFTLDTTREPLNAPGEYTICLWASTANGNGVNLDSMTVIISEPNSLILSGKVCTALGDPVEGAYVYVYRKEDFKLFGLAQSRTDGSWRVIGIPKDEECTILYSHSKYDFIPETQEIVMTESLDAGPAIASLKPKGDAQCSVTFSADRTEVTVGDPILFTVQGENATRVSLVVDGKEYESYSLDNNTGTFTRAFNKAGTRNVQLYAINADGYGQLSEAKQITVTAAGTLEKALFTNSFSAVTGTAKTISWKAVDHAEHYTLYLYYNDVRILQETVDSPATSFEIPGNLLSLPGNYFIELIAAGHGYEQKSSTALLTVYAEQTVKISGAFIDKDQHSVPGVQIRVIAESGSKIIDGGTDQTDEAGTFSFTLSKNSSYMFVWSKAGYRFDQNSIEITTEENDIQLAPVIAEKLGTAKLYLSAPFLVHWKNANTQTVEVYASESWSASADASWVTVSKDGNLLVVSMTQNTTGEVRTATITVTSGSESVLLPIAQEYGDTLLMIRSNGSSSGHLEKETAMRFMNYVWGDDTIRHEKKDFFGIFSWDTYKVNSEDDSVSDYWKLLIGENVGNKATVKKRFIVDVETRLGIIVSRKWDETKMKKVAEGLTHYVETNSTEELGLDLINDVIAKACEIPDPISWSASNITPENVAALITSAGVLKNMAETGPAEYLWNVIQRDSVSDLHDRYGISTDLANNYVTASTSYAPVRIRGLSDDQMREIASMLKTFHDEVY